LERKRKKKEEEKDRIVGKRKRGEDKGKEEEESSQFSLRSIRGTLEVKVLHHVPEHLIVFIICPIAL